MFYIIRYILKEFFNILELLIIVDALSTWIMSSRSNKFSRTIGIIIDPILEPCYKLQQRILPNLPIDFSPMIALLIIEFMKNILLNIF